MRLNHHFKLFAVLLGVGAILSACIGNKPIQALPENVVRMTMTAEAMHPVLPSATPAGPSCTLDSDCVLAYRADLCCSCSSIYNRQQVEDDRRLRYLNEPDDYRYKKWRFPRPICVLIMCETCPMLPYGLICDSGHCRAAQTWQEIWSACTPLEAEPKLWCHVNAATAAYQSGNLDKSVTICNSLEGYYAGEFTYSEECLFHVARVIMEDNPEESARFCRAHFSTLLSHCLNETAFSIGRSDIEAAVALCEEINPHTEYDRNEKNFCFHNVAMSVAKVDPAQAQKICEFMSQDVEQCKLDAVNPQGIP